MGVTRGWLLIAPSTGNKGLISCVFFTSGYIRLFLRFRGRDPTYTRAPRNAFTTIYISYVLLKKLAEKHTSYLLLAVCFLFAVYEVRSTVGPSTHCPFEKAVTPNIVYECVFVNMFLAPCSVFMCVWYIGAVRMMSRNWEWYGRYMDGQEGIHSNTTHNPVRALRLTASYYMWPARYTVVSPRRSCGRYR